MNNGFNSACTCFIDIQIKTIDCFEQRTHILYIELIVRVVQHIRCNRYMYAYNFI